MQAEGRAVVARDHRKLEAFHRADQPHFRVYHATKVFPKEELFVLTGRIGAQRCRCHSTLSKVLRVGMKRSSFSM
jgi:hypothetical protein